MAQIKKSVRRKITAAKTVQPVTVEQPRPQLYGLPGEETDEERDYQRIIEESIIVAADPEFVPRTLKLNGKPFTVELGPSLIRFYEGAVGSALKIRNSIDAAGGLC